MARQHETSAQPWGTLEELLLVCAVNRHGPKSWDSIGMEVQNRSTSFAPTAQDCRDKFDDLKRRFKSQNDNQSHSLVPMVDELRRLRVEELRREVRRRDVSIVSLELKVKKLEEERERSLKEEAEARLTDDPKRGGSEKEASPENLAGKTNSDEDFCSDSEVRENRSFNESNSTSQRGEAKANCTVGKQTEEEEAAAEPDRNQPDPVRTGIRSEPELDCSVNGKVIDDDDDEDNNNNKNKKGDTVVTRREKASRLGESNESMGDSKREGKGGGVASSKQNSDVQSSASLSKRKRRRRGGDGGGGGGSSSGEEPEGDEVSPATKRVKLVKLEPLVKVLRIIRSHRLGSVFERRLRSQESGRYKNLIRQHMDLHAVQSRLGKGVYTDCTHMFFRDLLIVFSNAVVFFRKTSPEHLAAQELRSLVLKEMNDQLPKPQPTTTLKSKPKIESDSAPLKPRKSSIVVCGKRCSVNALSEGGANNKRKGDKKERGGVEEKARVNEKKMDGSFVKIEDKDIRKKKTQERAGQRGTRSSSKNTDKTKHEYGGNELSSHDGLEVVKMDKKESVKKKQGVASFLKRMKQNSPSTKAKEGNSDDDSEDDSKDSMVEEEDEEEEEEEEKEMEKEKEKKKKKKKKKGTKKLDGSRERVTRSSTGNGGGRGGGRREESGRAKRGVGRPPKRPESAGARSGKRGRDNGESDQVGSAGRPRKRTRR